MPNGSFTVGEFDCKAAPDFVQALSATSPLFHEADDPNTWLFRGHRDAAFVLKPSAVRTGTKLLKERNIWVTVAPNWTYTEFVKAEYQTAKAFFVLADASGLNIPENNHLLREYFDRPTLPDSETEAWPIPEAMPLLALAQHNAVPTRLLDWSRNPYVAAYFAARDAALRLLELLKWRSIVDWDGRSALQNKRSACGPSTTACSLLQRSSKMWAFQIQYGSLRFRGPIMRICTLKRASSL